MVDNSNFKYQHSKLLQLLYEAANTGLINSEEKIKIKEMLMNKNPSIIQICTQYDIENNKTGLISALKKLCSSDNNQDNSDSEDEQPLANKVIGVNYYDFKISFLPQRMKP